MHSLKDVVKHIAELLGEKETEKNQACEAVEGKEFLRQYKQNPLFALTEEGKRKAHEIVGYLLFPRLCMRCI